MNSLLSCRSGAIAALLLLTANLEIRAQQPFRTDVQPQHGYVGVLVGPTQEINRGVLVRDIDPDGPATKSGLKRGDRIVKLDDDKIQNVESFLRAIAARKPGDTVKLIVLRDGKEETVSVLLGKMPSRERPALQEMQAPRGPAFLGVQMQELTPEIRKRLHIDAESGVLVTEIVPNSPADKAGLKRDDVITEVDKQPVRSAVDLRNEIQKAGPGKTVTLQVVHDKNKATVTVKLREGSLGYFVTPGEDRFPMVDVESMFDQGRRIRDLERRIEELEKRIRQLEKEKK